MIALADVPRVRPPPIFMPKMAKVKGPTSRVPQQSSLNQGLVLHSWSASSLQPVAKRFYSVNPDGTISFAVRLTLDERREFQN